MGVQESLDDSDVNLGSTKEDSKEDMHAPPRTPTNKEGVLERQVKDRLLLASYTSHFSDHSFSCFGSRGKGEGEEGGGT